MAGEKVVATGIIQAWSTENKPVQVVSHEDMRSKAKRACDMSTAFCGFAGVKVGGATANGVVQVEALCANAERCHMTDTTLQGGLDKLAASNGK